MCAHASVTTDNNLKEKIQGAWCTIGNPGYCTLQIEGDSAVWVDADPEHWYDYTIVGDTLTIQFPNEAEQASLPIAFAGDTLVIGNPEHEMPCLRLLPFATISIEGKRVKLPDSNDAMSEDKWVAIMERLYHLPLSGALLTEWNTLGLFTDGAVAETFDNYIADLYMKHSQIFLDWIYYHRDFDPDANNIKNIVMGGGEEIVGYPTKQSVRKDIQNIKDETQKKYLNKLLDDWQTE